MGSLGTGFLQPAPSPAAAGKVRTSVPKVTTHNKVEAKKDLFYVLLCTGRISCRCGWY